MSSYFRNLADTYDHHDLVLAIVSTFGIPVAKAAFFTSKSMREALVMGSARYLRKRGWN